MKNGKLTCDQVMALMSFYVENKLSEQLAKCVKEHLDKCPECAESYKNFQTMLGKYLNNIETKKILKTSEQTSQYQNLQYEEFKKHVSEYFDNELDDNENIKIKKIAITNPLARKDLESMYTFKKLLHDSFEKTKNEIKEDYSKDVVSVLKNDINFTGTDSFFRLAASFLMILFSIIIGFYIIML